MDCRRAEELLSDHFEGTLAEPLLSDLERHLRECASCRALRAALAQVVESLRDFPVLEPPAGLAERAAATARARPRAVAPPRREGRIVGVPPWLRAVAAGLFLVTTGVVFLVTGTERPSRAMTRLMDRTTNAGAYLMERKDRLVEDIRLLGVVVSTAFEGRIDRMSDRVDDYRRMLERRRLNEQEQKKNRGSHAGASLGRRARAGPVFRTELRLDS